MIIKNNEEALRVHCEDVLENEVYDLISTLENELEHSSRMGNPGIGLAAPQVGIAKNISIIRLDKFKINLVNCKISNFYDPIIFKEEGCLSFPGRVENTKRFNEIYVSYNFGSFPFIATGLLAIAIQHEIDHLNKILFIDKKI